MVSLKALSVDPLQRPLKSTHMPIRKTLRRTEIADSVRLRIGHSHAESRELVEQLLRHMSGALWTGEWVQIRGFGPFEVRQKRAREGRNPKTQEPAAISARRILCFRPSGNLCKQLHEG